MTDPVSQNSGESSAPALGGSAYYAGLRAQLPYPGIDAFLSYADFQYDLLEMDETARKLAGYLGIIGDPGRDIASPEDFGEGYLPLRILLRGVGLYDAYNESGNAGYAPQLRPIAEAVNDSVMHLQEHVEAAAEALLGDGYAFRHQSIIDHDTVGWIWHPDEGGYTPPHMGVGPDPIALVLGYTETDGKITAEAVFFHSDLWWGDQADFEERLNGERTAVLLQEPRYEAVFRKDGADGLIFKSLRVITEADQPAAPDGFDHMPESN